MPHQFDERNGQRARSARDNDNRSPSAARDESRRDSQRNNEDAERGERQAYSHDYDRDYSRGGSSYGRGYGDYASGMTAGREYGTSTNYGRDDGDLGGGQRYGQGRSDYGSDRDYRDRLDRSQYGQSSASGIPYGNERGYRGEQDDPLHRADAYANAAEHYATSHRGRGPKGYLRSDDRIKEDISERLSDDHHIDASDISIEVKSGVVTLTGTVDERRLKHRVEDIADAVSGVTDVQNRLTVASSAANKVGGTNIGTATSGAGTGNRGVDTTPKH